MQGTPWQAFPGGLQFRLISDQLAKISMLRETKTPMVQDMTASAEIQYVHGA